jgi:hypothetical protein
VLSFAWLEISLRDQVTAKTAKTRNNYMPRFVFYPKIRLLFIENRLLHKIRKSASLYKSPKKRRQRVPEISVVKENQAAAKRFLMTLYAKQSSLGTT